MALASGLRGTGAEGDRPMPWLARLWQGALVWALLLALMWPLLTPGPALAADPSPDGRGVTQPGSRDRCAPQDMRVRAVPESRLASSPLTRPPSSAPDAVWTDVELPDNWNRTKRWRGMDGAVWYRVDWTLPCAEHTSTAQTPWALRVDSVNMAGEVWVGDTLFWRDRQLSEPLSISWNVSRMWVLPQAVLARHNTAWVRVVGVAVMSPGMGVVEVADANTVLQHQKTREWNSRTMQGINLVMSAALGLFFLAAWLWRREQTANGWFAAASLCWVAFIFHSLMTETRPLHNVVVLSRLSLVALLTYTACFVMFTWRFAGRRHPRQQRALGWGLAVMLVLVAVLPLRWHEWVWLSAVLMSALVFNTNCLQFIVWAWRTRDHEQMLLAACLLVCLVVGMHDVLTVLRLVPDHGFWIPYASLGVTICMAVVLGGRMANSLQRIERFNEELRVSIDDARAELRTTMAREHTLMVHNARLNERLGLAHELHDGLGGALVRAIAQVEQSDAPLPRGQSLSVLKHMRDDLRQLIDSGSSLGVAVPESPRHWLAPLRHRFVQLLDELDIQSDWQVPPHWPARPTPLQCMVLTRVIEEGMTNIVKHSRARQVQVQLSGTPDTLHLRVRDDGLGFDAEAVQQAGISVGLRSMQARVARVGGQLQVQSAPGGSGEGTTLQVQLPVERSDSAPAAL